jgi:hypothetical protein
LTIAASGNVAELLELVEAAFNEVAFLVFAFAVLDGLKSV